MALLPYCRPASRTLSSAGEGVVEFVDAVGGGEQGAREREEREERVGLPEQKWLRPVDLWGVAPLRQPTWPQPLPNRPGQPIRRGPRGQRGGHRFSPARAWGAC